MEGLGFLDESVARQLTENVRAIFLETGTFAKRPSPGRRKGHVWFAWDTDELYIWNGSSWLLVATGSDSFTVKVSSDDTTNKFLEDALVAGTGISLATTNPGANEKVQITGHAEAHGDDQHEGRIIDGGASLPGSGEDGEMFYKTADKHPYLYQT